VAEVPEKGQQAWEGPWGQVASVAFCALPLLHWRQAGALVGVHRRPERPRSPHPAQPRHITRRQTGGGAHIHRTTQTSHYSFTVTVRSDSYLGLDVHEDIKLEVCEAKEAVTEHPQWEFEDDEEESDGKSSDSEDDEFATDDDYDEDED